MKSGRSRMVRCCAGPLQSALVVDPVVTDPYFHFGQIQINTDMGPVFADLSTPDLTGFIMGPAPPNAQVPLLDGWGAVLLVLVLLASTILLVRQQRGELAG